MRSIALFLSKRFSMCCIFTTIVLLLSFLSSPAVVAMNWHLAAGSTGTQAPLSPALQDAFCTFRIGIPRSLSQLFFQDTQKLLNTRRDSAP